MTKEVESCLNKIKAKIARIEAKDADLKQNCREKWDVDWYGMTRWEEEYEKRHVKYQQELDRLMFYSQSIYQVYLAAVEKGLEDGTKTERIYLGIEEETHDESESAAGD